MQLGPWRCILYKISTNNLLEFEKQSGAEHRALALEYIALDDAARNRFYRLNGARYFELLRLPYFDPVRMTIIDPMHNILLGKSAHFLLFKLTSIYRYH